MTSILSARAPEAAATPRTTSADGQRWVQRAIALAWFTIVYNLVEGVVAMGFGIADESIALFGFGADSFIEVASAGVVLWRFRGEVGRAAPIVRERERKATLWIGALFLLLAVATSAGSLLQLFAGRHPDTTIPGVIVSVVSLSFMFFLWSAKTKAALALGSKTVAADAACSLACIKLSAVLFAGSVVVLAAPALWWADAAAALVLAVLIGREGWETIENARRADFDGGCGCGHDACST